MTALLRQSSTSYLPVNELQFKFACWVNWTESASDCQSVVCMLITSLPFKDLVEAFCNVLMYVYILK